MSIMHLSKKNFLATKKDDTQKAIKDEHIPYGNQV